MAQALAGPGGAVAALRSALFLGSALLSVALLGFAGGSGGFGALAEACGLTTLPAAQPAVEAVQDFDPSLTLLAPAPDFPLTSSTDTHTCVGQIRPGAQQSNGCTLSWIFTDQNGAYYQTTAGHCTSSVGQSIGATGVGTIGSVVYRVNAGVGNDIALIRINPALYNLVNPTLCHWGGPVGMATPQDAGTAGTQHDGMLHYGWGVMWRDQETRARAGYIPNQAQGPPAPTMTGTGWFQDGSVRMKGFTDGGDSGSPMMLKGGLAAGVHTHRLDSAPNGYGVKAASRLDIHVPRIEAALGLDLTIANGGPVDITGLTIQD
jgi:hypothetical protein